MWRKVFLRKSNGLREAGPSAQMIFARRLSGASSFLNSSIPMQEEYTGKMERKRGGSQDRQAEG